MSNSPSHSHPDSGVEASSAAGVDLPMTIGNDYRLLLVEDSPSDVRLLHEYLHFYDTAQFEIEVAPRLSQAIEMLRHTHFDIVLLDLSLPDTHGIETLTALLREAPDAAVIVLTGLQDDALALAAVRNGAQDYLVKNQIDEATLGRSLLLAIERQHLQEQLKLLAIEDSLTGLLNRRGLQTMSRQLLRSAQREARILAVFYIDLDDMKGINDRFGHREGDWALAQTAAVLRQTFRESDVIARLGGDEFAVCATLKIPENAETVIERLQRNLQIINEQSQRPYQIHLSVGSAPLDPQHDTIDAALARADNILYQDKRRRKLKSQSH